MNRHPPPATDPSGEGLAARGESTGLAGRLPEPSRLWVRYRPRHWPGGEGLWVDLWRLGLGSRGRGSRGLPASLRAVDDVLYLPPVDESLRAERRRLAGDCAQGGVPVLVQEVAGSAPAEEGGGAPGTTIWDLLAALLAEDFRALRELPEGSDAVWPLVPGVTDAAELVEAGTTALAGAGLRAVQGVVVELPARDRRRLADRGGEELFERLFHGPPPSERDFSRRVAAAGLAPFVPRPLPAGPPRLTARRRVAGELRLAAELWRRLERSEARGHALLRAARWVDGEDVDLEALVAEDNLGVAEPVDELAGRAIAAHFTGDPSLVDELLAEYLAPRSD